MGQENNLLQQNLNLGLSELKNILLFISEIRFSQNIIDRLICKPLFSWVDELKFIKTTLCLPLKKDSDYLLREQCSSYLLLIRRKYSEKFFEQLMQILIEKSFFKYESVNLVLDNIIRLVWTLDDSIIMELEKNDVDKWKDVFIRHQKFLDDMPCDMNKILQSLHLQFSDSDLKNSTILQEEKNLFILNQEIEKRIKKASKIDDYDFFLLPIQNWKKEHFNDWSAYIKKNGSTEWIKQNIYHVLAVIGQAVKLTKEYYPRITQYAVVWLLFVVPENQKGRLAQVATGEGKTLITVMLAILKVLSGEPMDIITSSSLLAVRDASANESLYSILGIRVANNCDEECQKNVKERQKRFRECQVIYGDIGSFQRDLLLTTFLEQDVLSNRHAKSVIVDEVDSMLIDKSDNILYLSHPIPDLRRLRMLYVEIWVAVNDPSIQSFHLSEKILRVLEYIRKKIDHKESLFPATLRSLLICG